VIHGDKNQLQRCHALNEFKLGAIQTLVATDVAARGLDIEELSCVINFELPDNPEDYIHRIGRTGRAGARGFALSLVCPEEEKLLSDIEKLLNKKIKIEKITQFEKNQELKEKSRPKMVQSDKNLTHNLPQKNKKGSATHRYAEITYFNGKQANRGSISKTNDIKDPFFTQPYISQVYEEKTEKDFGFGQKSGRNKQRRSPAKPVPALFAPPVSK
jgi:ATP-dependent RNA helicase RhlE